MKRVCVFCGSSHGAREEYSSAAREMGGALVRRGLELVYGGGSVGLMGVLADSVLSAGGHVIGVIPRALATKELAHAGLPDMRVVGTMHERKALMADLSGGFVALPGGYGTLEELCEVVTWAQLGIHAKPCGVLNVAGYYDPILALFDHAVEERFVKLEHRRLVLTAGDPETLLDRMAAYKAPSVEKWIGKEAT